MNLNDYKSSKDFFYDVREAKKDLLSMKRVLDSMEASEQSLPSGIVELSRSSGNTANVLTIVRLDRLNSWKEKIEEATLYIDAAYKVLYGRETADVGGLAHLLGMTYAEVLDCRYVSLLSWSDIGKKLGYSRRRLFDLQKIAFEYLDYNGLVETAETFSDAT